MPRPLLEWAELPLDWAGGERCCYGVVVRIVLFGLPLAALLLAADGHSVEAVFCSRRDALGLRRARRVFGDRLVISERPRAGAAQARGQGPAATAGFDAAAREDPRVAQRLLEARPDLLVSWFWTRRIPVEWLRIVRMGAIGAHPSLLPRHRGPDPTFWTIDAGDATAGVTVHRLDESYDTGAILARAAIDVDPRWNAWQLARALDRPSLRLLRDVVGRLARGETIPEEPQDESLATEAPFPTEDQTSIRWTWGVAPILRRIRALAPAPGAWTEIEGRAVVVVRAEAAATGLPTLLPGEGTVVDGVATVRCGDGAIRLLEAEIDGAPAGAEDIARLFTARRVEVEGPVSPRLD